MKEMIPKVGRPTEFDAYEMFDSIDECAEKAVKVFQKNQWTWGGGLSEEDKGFVPNFEQIKECLEGLKNDMKTSIRLGLKHDWWATGRLIAKRDKYGHEILDAEGIND